MKVLHIFASRAKFNSGDFFLGPSTKWEFEKKVGRKCEWVDFDVRTTLNKKHISFFNTFEAIVIGGGGLFLPDTNPNTISCWQFAIPKDFIKDIKTDIYVISVGLNWFFGQDASMPSRNNNSSVPGRVDIFRENIDELIGKSKYFSMRHNGDIRQLNSFVKLVNKNKIKFEFCPVIKYVQTKYRQGFKPGELITFEIKDDRPTKRYIGTNIKKVYETLYQFILHLEGKGEKIGIMSHDGSKSFLNFVKKKGFSNFKFLNNTVANESAIINNYGMVKKLYCSAGHSQMTAHALGLDFYSLISHHKLKYFMEDTNRLVPKDGNFVKEITLENLIKNFKGS